jgi:TraG-like protein, N-terminal region.
MTPTIYVVGNIKSFFSALTALQMLFNPGNNTLWASGNGAFGGGPLIALGLVITLVILFISTILKQRFEMHQVLMLVIVYGLMFGVHTSVNIENMYSGDSSIVQGVPVGIAYPASIFSTVAFVASEQIGEAFQQANNTDTSLFTGANGAGGVYGFDGPLAITYKMRGIYSLFSMQDAPLSNSVSSFVGSCVEPTNDVAEGDIGKSGNLACSFFDVGCGAGEAALPLANAQATLYVNSSDGTINPKLVNCSTAAATLGRAWTAFQQSTSDYGTPNLANLLSEKTIGASHNNETPTEASELIGTMLQGTANTGYNYMNNMILNCSFQAGEHEGLSVYDPNMPSSMESYCVTKASAFGRQVAMNAGTASLFGMNMLPLMAILQFLFFAMAPIVVGVAMMQGMAGLSNLGKYLLFGAWTESWMPVAALINDYSQQIIGDTFTKLRDNMSSGLHITSPAYLGSILDHAQRDLSMANLMMSLTPVLTFAILSGSYYAFSQMGTAIRGDSVMDKNMSLSTPTDGTSALTNGGTERTMVSTGNGNLIGTGLGLSSLSYNLGQTVQHGESAANNSAIQLADTASTSASKVGEQTASYLHNAQQAVASGTTLSNGANDTLSTMSAAQQTLKSMTGLSEANATTFAARLSGELGGNLNAQGISEGMVAKALSGFDIGGKAAAEEAARITGEMKTSAGLEAAKTLTNSNNLSQLSGSTPLTNSSSAGTTANLGVAAKKAWQEGATAAAAATAAESWQETSSKIASQGGNQVFNAENLASALENTAAQKRLSAHSFANDIASRYGLQGNFDAGVAAANKQGIIGSEAAAYGLLYAANRAKGSAGADAIIEASEISPLTGQTGNAAQRQIQSNYAGTNASQNAADVQKAKEESASVNAATGGAPTTGTVNAEYDAGKGQADSAIGSNNGNRKL